MDEESFNTPPSADVVKVEMMWGHKQELQVVKWKEEAHEKVVEHKKKYKKLKCYHLMMTIPTIIVPIVASSMADMITVRSMVVMMVVTGLNSFLNFSKKQEAHSQFEMQWTVFSLAGWRLLRIWFYWTYLETSWRSRNYNRVLHQLTR